MEKPLLEGEPSTFETGLSSAEASARLTEFGRNEVPIEEEPLWKVFMRQFTGTMPMMLILACILSAAVEDYQDLGIIFAMLFVNACIAFYEETKAKGALDALRGELKQHVSVLRDGGPITLDAAELVPGDVVSLRGGQAVPADALWLGGDVIKLDTAVLTGEPIPRTVPGVIASRLKDEDEEKVEHKNTAGRQMLSGCVVVQGECQVLVTATGVRTEIGQAAQMVAESKAGPRAVGLFESKIMAVVKLLIACTLVATAVVFVYQFSERGESFGHILLVSLSLVIGAVPIALPLVLQVTMALGARAMAEHGAIVTHTTALQEIASMTVLNSDKTGTLTTAKMSIMPDMIWLAQDDDILGAAPQRVTADECLVLAALASNPANLEDPVDASVFRAVRARFSAPEHKDPDHPQHGTAAKARLASYGRREKFDGFNPDVKRAVARYRMPNDATLRVAKGLLDKILDTGNDGAAEQWTCSGVGGVDKRCEQEIAAAVAEDLYPDAVTTASRADAARDAVTRLGGGVRARALAADAALSAAGYKTIAVCAALSDERNTGGGGGEMRLVGLVPMLDPPRHDTSATIDALDHAGVRVKMITGDHVNIARETARLVGLGDRVLPQTDLWPASATRDETIWLADGFAQVMPMDKREVVLVLQNRGLVVGMTGDGVNDAAALAQAQVGIAVEGATDAASNAADIVLTRPGLSAIYAAVYESRLIFRRLRAYVLYRVAATVQIVCVLCALIFGWDDELKPIYVVLLALLNDVTMMPIAHDHVEPSPEPEVPETAGLLLGSLLLGLLQAVASIGFYTVGGWVTGIDGWHANHNGARRQVAVYAQISISVELLIFACRAPKPFFLTKPPSLALFTSVFAGNILVTLMCAFGIVVARPLSWSTLGRIWLFDAAAFCALDLCKVLLLWTLSLLELQSRSLADPDVIARALASKDEADAVRVSVARSVLSDTRSERPSAFSREHGRASYESLGRPSLQASLRPKTPAFLASMAHPPPEI
ncbi:hypothetical protein CTAYLR_000289 [Chrysophaeum taylorii]|uniref:Cation-transporting P-type ATPase N-terminal domain-containing protein n=1 Tax=Chrysophaeum taylorii TaxID=2483200 RepID=A0AAD7UFZ2_9STRA|nr:hypothetical protein CTAYLR_000289 [Chrysophaeum taylorii]